MVEDTGDDRGRDGENETHIANRVLGVHRAHECSIDRPSQIILHLRNKPTLEHLQLQYTLISFLTYINSDFGKKNILQRLIQLDI